jgi:hypothetical protein
MFRSACFLFTLPFLLLPALLRGQTATQSVPLVAGWNSVWLEVDPAAARPEQVFAGLPLEQVWCYFPTARPVQFIDDPAAAKWNRESWSSWRPAGHPEVFLNDLSAVFGGRAYLIKASGAAALTVTGTPVVRPLTWRADSFNLVGFPMDPASSGQLATTFFSGVPELAASQKFRLTPAGTWTAFGATDRIRSGQAFWIFANGAAQFSGPLRLSARELVFPPQGTEQTLIVRNDSSLHFTATVTNTASLPILLAVPEPGNGRTAWTPLASTTLTLPPFGEASLRLGANRTNLNATAANTLTISGGGAVLKVPARIEVAAETLAAGSKVGLWVGDVTFDNVTDVNNSPTIPVPSAGTFSMRVLVHVSASGQVKMLKQVTLMKKIEPPGAAQHFALITDDLLLPSFTGATTKDGKPFGGRISAIGYDFSGNELPLTGAFGGTLSGTIAIGRNLPTHPMKHRYHPDHDDKDAQFLPLPAPYPANYTPDKQEVWDISRAVQITFTAPPAAPDPRAAATATASYSETITGLHRQPVKVTGTVELSRLSAIGELNPVP